MTAMKTRSRPEVAPGVQCVHSCYKAACLDLSDAEWEEQRIATAEFRKKINMLRAEVDFFSKLKTDGQDYYVTF